MCLLIVLRGFHEDHPVIVASNRDEHLDRKAAPPGLWVGERRRILSPRDRQAGGTWIGINDRGLFAGLTNIAGHPPLPGAPTRGALPHLALEQDDIATAAAAVAEAATAGPPSAFQLVLCDGERTVVVRHSASETVTISWEDRVLVVSNEHAPGELILPLLDRCLGDFPSALERLAALKPLLLDRGGEHRHPVLKKGDDYGTVSSSLVLVPAKDPLTLVWQYAAGSPDETPYRNYGNLGRRLLED